jgi:hypothetical protein
MQHLTRWIKNRDLDCKLTLCTCCCICCCRLAVQSHVALMAMTTRRRVDISELLAMVWSVFAGLHAGPFGG